MKPSEKHKVVHDIVRIPSYVEGITSLLAGTYVLSLAVLKNNVALRAALGVAGGYLILRSGSKLRGIGPDVV